jgi:8-amino-7-oxononanoate synthase
MLQYSHLPLGATGSRLLSGNTELAEQLEQQIARFHATEAALIFNSGFAANTGFFSAVPQRGDTIFYDDASHASIKDGIRLSFAKAYSFQHNSPEDLCRKMRHATGEVYVAVESLYSMDGDFAPLPELAAICSEKRAYLVVDEAHATGLYGPDGAGLVQANKLADKIFARIITFGKALGSHGAAVVGSHSLRDYLINFSRPFIYTTALPLPALLSIQAAYTLLPALSGERKKLFALTARFQELLGHQPHLKINPVPSPIQWLQAPTTQTLKIWTQHLQAAGIDARPIFSPTVAPGQERIRLVMHAFNTLTELEQLMAIISELR